MSHAHPGSGRPPSAAGPRRDRGAAAARVFAFAVLACVGIVLMSLGQDEVGTGRASAKTRRALVLAEAGPESATRDARPESDGGDLLSPDEATSDEDGGAGEQAPEGHERR